MADEAVIRVAMAENLAAITGHQSSPWFLSNPTVPGSYIQAAEDDFDLAMGRGLDLLRFNVWVLVGTIDNEGAQRLLAEFRSGSGPRSIKENLDADELAGVWDSVRVKSVGEERGITFAGQGPYLGCEFRVEVRASGD